MNHFTIQASHTAPVPAGTVVVFTVKPEKNGPSVDSYTYEWVVRGPFTGMSRSVPGGSTFDWDTQGLRAGSYSVQALRTPQGGTGAAGQTGGGGAAAPPTQPAPSGASSAPFGQSVQARGRGAAAAPGPPAGQAAPPASPATAQPLAADPSMPFIIQVTAGPASNQDGIVPVSLQRTALIETADQALWVIIRNRTNAIGFNSFRPFIDSVLASEPAVGVRGQPRGLSFRGPDAYILLKTATDAFLMQEVGVLDPYGVVQAGFLKPGDPRIGAGLLDPDLAMDSIDEQFNDPALAEAIRLQEKARLGRSVNANDIRRLRDAYYVHLTDELNGSPVLPYLKIIRDKLSDIPLKSPGETPLTSYGILRSHLTAPLAIELIWSYWHEEGWLAQTLNAVLARFQNRRLGDGGHPDPLARFDIDPLRPLGNLFWGWVQDEVHRLSVRRRHYEYLQEYGLPLIGRAIPDIQAADTRSKFIEAFHNLLFLSHVFFKEDDDTTVIADGFPLLNSLRETHLLLAEGAHNQFGDLPSTARAEMLIMEWLLARPEMRDFLGGRIMVPYEEGWMDRVDTMKTLQGWSDTSVTHFRDMGVFGEQILLSIRYGNWSVENNPQTAANWARYWRAEIQRYAHAYRAATGADLTEVVDATPPATHLLRRLEGQRAGLDRRRTRQVGGRRQPAQLGRSERVQGVITRRDQQPTRRELP
jgi:hypothetical protein